MCFLQAYKSSFDWCLLALKEKGGLASEEKLLLFLQWLVSDDHQRWKWDQAHSFSLSLAQCLTHKLPLTLHLSETKIVKPRVLYRKQGFVNRHFQRLFIALALFELRRQRITEYFLPQWLKTAAAVKG